MVGNGVHQMGFSQSYASMQEKRVIHFTGCLGNGQGRGVGKLVVAADHKGVEGKLRAAAEEAGTSVIFCSMASFSVMNSTSYFSPVNSAMATKIGVLNLEFKYVIICSPMGTMIFTT